MSWILARFTADDALKKNKLPLNREVSGITDKLLVGLQVGETVGSMEGISVGSGVGSSEGTRVGFTVGIRVGFLVVVGANEKDGAGTGVGATLASVGDEVGADEDG